MNGGEKNGRTTASQWWIISWCCNYNLNPVPVIPRLYCLANMGTNNMDADYWYNRTDSRWKINI